MPHLAREVKSRSPVDKTEKCGFMILEEAEQHEHVLLLQKPLGAAPGERDGDFYGSGKHSTCRGFISS